MKNKRILVTLVVLFAAAFVSCSTAPRAHAPEQPPAAESPGNTPSDAKAVEDLQHGLELKLHYFDAYDAFNAAGKEEKVAAGQRAVDAAVTLSNYFKDDEQYDQAYIYLTRAYRLMQEAGIEDVESGFALCIYDLEEYVARKNGNALTQILYCEYIRMADKKRILSFVEDEIELTTDTSLDEAEAEALPERLGCEYIGAWLACCKAAPEGMEEAKKELIQKAANYAGYCADEHNWAEAYRVWLSVERAEKRVGNLDGGTTSFGRTQIGMLIFDGLSYNGEILLQILRCDEISGTEKEMVLHRISNMMDKLDQAGTDMVMRKGFDEAVAAFENAPADKKRDAAFAAQEPAKTLGWYYREVEQPDLAYLVYLKLAEIEKQVGIKGEQSVSEFELGRIPNFISNDGRVLTKILKNKDIPWENKQHLLDSLASEAKANYSKDTEPSVENGNP